MKKQKIESHNIYVDTDKDNKKEDKITTEQVIRLDEKRCLTVKEFQQYCNVGRNNAFKLIRKSKAGVYIGKKILVDRLCFDSWLEKMETEEDGQLL